MTSIPRVFIFFLIFAIFFVTLVAFEILSNYSNTDSSHGLRRDVQLIIDEVIREKFKV